MKQSRTSSRRRTRYQKDPSDSWQHILLFYILPFVLFNGLLFYCVTTAPRLTVTVADTTDYLSTEVQVSITSLFPSKEPTVTIDGEALELTREKNRTYTAQVYRNGSIEANVKNINGMSSTAFELVSVLDDTPPSLEDASIADGVVTLTVKDSQSGVAFDTIYAMNAANEKVEPLSVDRSSNTLSYEIDLSGLHVYAQDKAGNEVHGTFTTRKEGDVERLESTIEEPQVVPGESASSQETDAKEASDGQ